MYHLLFECKEDYGIAEFHTYIAYLPGVAGLQFFNGRTSYVAVRYTPTEPDDIMKSQWIEFVRKVEDSTGAEFVGRE